MNAGGQSKDIDSTRKRRKTKTKNKRKRSKSSDDGCHFDDDASEPSRKKSKKEKKRRKGERRKLKLPDDVVFKKSKKKKRERRESDNREDSHGNDNPNKLEEKESFFSFEYQHILAPMVGASELAFRLLCRKYGATLSYTPMMSASQFVNEARAFIKNGQSNLDIGKLNICEFQTIPQDRPLVAHFSANNPEDFATAAKLVESCCDAVDLNLGCPQRTAYLGHFGSYMLGDSDRQLVLDIVRAASKAVSIPIFVKIRLLDTIEETINLCRQLRDAGASLIAIHARYRASWERIGPGARDGPALLDQVSLVKQVMPNFPIISNGNVITYSDVVENKKMTGANGIMSAEGILNNPALYLPRLGDGDKDGDREVSVPTLSSLHNSDGPNKKQQKVIRKLQKKLREIEAIEKKVKDSGDESINSDQRSKLQAKSKIQTQLNGLNDSSSQSSRSKSPKSVLKSQTSVKLSELFKTANNKVLLAREYLSLVRLYPVKIRSVVFHTRRMCKDLLEKYQLLEECVASTTIDEVDAVLSKCEQYVKHPDRFQYDQHKAAREKEALAHRHREEGKRKAYEARMMRKAKREGLADLEHYLRIGAEVPTVEIVKKLKAAHKDERLAAWKKDHSQHCMPYHLDDGGCKRDRTCAFLHVEAKDGNKFVEDDEVAG
mmetsp:Transcript_13173/g.28503  ORF Transcript_13173/g.28503 Transcript_13173/m.28503 type:complete len:661 (-) Transcript_13173:106-2088(-)